MQTGRATAFLPRHRLCDQPCFAHVRLLHVLVPDTFKGLTNRQAASTSSHFYLDHIRLTQTPMDFSYDHPIKLIAVDLDGTLLDSEHNVSPRTMKALRAAMARGVDIV